MTPLYNCFDSRWESVPCLESINRIRYQNTKATLVDDQWLGSHRLRAANTRLALWSAPYREAYIFCSHAASCRHEQVLARARLDGQEPQQNAKTLSRLRFHVMSEQLLGLVIIALVSILASLPLRAADKSYWEGGLL